MQTPGKKFSDLVEIEEIKDTDITVVRNETGVKKTPMQKISDYVKQKFIAWVFEDLPTEDKTIPGAFKELNSALTNGKIYNAGDYDANILTYAETLRDNSFTIIRYRGYSSTGEPINAAPTNASGAAIIIRTSINYMAIIAIPFDNTGVYSRVKDNGTWKAWTH